MREESRKAAHIRAEAGAVEDDSRGDERGPVDELVVLNYPPELERRGLLGGSARGRLMTYVVCFSRI